MKGNKSLSLRRRRINSPTNNPLTKNRLRPSQARIEQRTNLAEADLCIPEDMNETSVPVIKEIMTSRLRIFLGLLVFRMINAVVIQTWYVPDEFWQSLEVAHRAAFGYGHLTWEWTYAIRSFSYPAVFTIAYKAMASLHMDYRVPMMKIPRLMQAVLATFGDYYLYKLSSCLAGPQVGYWSLLCQIASWFMFYCGTRTLTNSAEATLLPIVLYYFPWPGIKKRKEDWKFIALVAVSVIIRPTAAITCGPLCLWHIYINRVSLLRTLLSYLTAGFVFLASSMVIDYIMYGQWVISQLNFLNVNVFHNIGTFYGSHPWHWYLTQGVPGILSGHIVSVFLGVWINTDRRLMYIILWTVFVYSLLGHKEFRFVMPILPMCMHYCGSYLHYLCKPNDTFMSFDEDYLEVPNQMNENGSLITKRTPSTEALQSSMSDITDSGIDENAEKYTQGMKKRYKRYIDSKSSIEQTLKICISTLAVFFQKGISRVNKLFTLSTPRPDLARWFMIFLIVSNLPLAFYFSLVHQRGTTDVMKYVYNVAHKQRDSSTTMGNKKHASVLFLMPCHSTPYYSYVHRNITMRFLTCEPNLDHIPSYRDEAEEFYEKPVKWLNKHIKRKSDLPSHVIMFDILHGRIQTFLDKHGYVECARFFHTQLPEGRIGRYVTVKCRGRI